MTSSISVLLDPDDTPESARTVKALANLDSGAVVLEPTPGSRTPGAICNDLAEALGKRPDRGGHTSNVERARPLLRAWLIGEQITDIVVSRAHLAADRDWRWLTNLASEIDARLTFVVNHAFLARERESYARAHNATVGLLAESPRAEAGWSSIETHCDLYPEVPRVEFPAFAPRCHELLRPDELKVVAATHRHAMERTHDLLGSGARLDEETLATHLRDLVGQAQDANEALTSLRGAQTALLLEANIYAKIDVGVFLAAATRDQTMPLGRLATRRLREYLRPDYPAAAVLVGVARGQTSHIAALNLADLAADGSSATIDGTTLCVPAELRPPLRAQHALRRSETGDPRAPLFTTTTPRRATIRAFSNTIDYLASRVRDETNLLIATAANPLTGDPKRWARRHGISLHRLTRRAA